MSTTAVPTLTPTQKRKATRDARKAKQAEAFDFRWSMFNEMEEKDRTDMIDRIEAIKDEYRVELEQEEERLLDEAREKLMDVVSGYGYDETKAYLEGDFNGREAFGSILDLDHAVDEWAADSCFSEESGTIVPTVPTQADVDFVRDMAKRTSTQAGIDTLPVLAKKGDITEDGKHVVMFDEEPDDVCRIVREITPGETCGTCGRPWINGKCEGGFINHKL
jgi:hypothetical protein